MFSKETSFDRTPDSSQIIVDSEIKSVVVKAIERTPNVFIDSTDICLKGALESENKTLGDCYSGTFPLIDVKTGNNNQHKMYMVMKDGTLFGVSMGCTMLSVSSESEKDNNGNTQKWPSVEVLKFRSLEEMAG